MKRKNMQAKDIHISYVGLNALHLDVADMSQAKDINEVVLRIAIRADEKAEVEKLIPKYPRCSSTALREPAFSADVQSRRKSVDFGPLLCPVMR